MCLPHDAGAVTFTMMIISRWIFSKFGWGMAALITPTVLLLTGARVLPPKVVLLITCCSLQFILFASASLPFTQV